MTPGATHNPDQALRALLQRVWKAKRTVFQAQDHLSDSVLYDLALGECTPEERERSKRHLAECLACVERLTVFQRAIAADRAVYAVWEPRVLYAAGNSESVPVIQDLTTDGKYVITLQPTEDGEQDLLTLAVTPSFREQLEGTEVVVVSCKGTVVLHGTISGGDITRLVHRRLREEWPFRIHAA